MTLLLTLLAAFQLPHMEGTPAWDVVRVVAYSQIAPLYGHRPTELVALAWRESRMKQHPPRSHAGACGAFQALGGRYGHPSCRKLEGDLFLAFQWACADLRYWKQRCGKNALQGYNSGKCKGSPRFMRQVNKAERRLR